MTTKFDIGARVKLVSGGPSMTVIEVNGKDRTCTWFTKSKGGEHDLKSGSFPVDALKEDTGRAIGMTVI